MAVKTDDLDHEEVETAVQREMKTRVIQQGFCKDCQDLLGNWPHLGAEYVPQVVQAGRYNTIELEAGARNGCRFCGFLFSRYLKADTLDIIRRLERRLEAVGDRTQSSLSFLSLVSCDMCPPVYVRINYPGDISTEYLCTGLDSFEAEAVDPTGKQRGLLRDSVSAETSPQVVASGIATLTPSKSPESGCTTVSYPTRNAREVRERSNHGPPE